MKKNLQIELTVRADHPFQGKVEEEHLNRLTLQTLGHEEVQGQFTLGLLITDDENIKTLNLRYRGQDTVTDVLAFGMEDDQGSFVPPGSLPVHLGDIVVSYPRALAQAEEYGHSVEEELDRLVVHGLLHLLGYDDQSEAERQRMWDTQEAILRESQQKRRQ